MRLITLALVAALTMLAAPATAQEEPVEPVLYEPCANAADFDAVITPAEGFSGTVTTPIEPLLLSEEDAGSYLLDLSGLTVGTQATVNFTLEWDTPLGLGDYDLIINGNNAEVEGDTPETHVLPKQAHCKAFDLATTSYQGTPLDTLTLSISAK